MPEETKSTFSVEMSYDSMYQWLLQNGVDEEDCQLLKGHYKQCDNDYGSLELLVWPHIVEPCAWLYYLVYPRC